MIENEEIDFVYGNSGIYTCLGTEHSATALATAVKHLT
jgi:hypothetical protein